MSWEITHLMLRATHPPTPHSYAPRSVALLPNVASTNFSDFEDPTVTTISPREVSPGVFVVPLEQFRSKGTFRRVTSLSLRLSVVAAGQQESEDGAHDDSEAQVFINDLALFGLPGESGSARSAMMDERANLIVSPVLNRRRWGEEVGDDKPEGDEEEENMAVQREDREPLLERPQMEVPASAFPATALTALPGDRAFLACARESCPFRVHELPFYGGYCCSSCSQGGPHSPQCQQVLALPGSRKADPTWRPVDDEKLEQRA